MVVVFFFFYLFFSCGKSHIMVMLVFMALMAVMISWLYMYPQIR